MERRLKGMGKSWLVVGVMLTLAVGAVCAATPQEDAAQANTLFQQGKMDAALPLYERLAAADVANSVFAERLALCLYAMMEIQPEGERRDQLIIRARQEAERAGKLGSKSTMLPQVLARLNSDEVHRPDPEQQQLREAEAAFTRGDLDTALAGYKAVAASDPASYHAHLYAGDVYYNKGDVAAAAEWFGKAIAINPDIETAYRYWGDALSKAGDDQAALVQYIRAVVAEPYKPNTVGALAAWAQRNGAMLRAPQLPRPQVSLKDDGSGKGPQPAINMTPEIMSDKLAAAAWLAYAINRTVWVKEKFLQRHPEAGEYRHSLEEEVESLGLAVKVIEKDMVEAAEVPALKDLLRLSADNMLEPYVLLNGVDAGIAQDYAAYRHAHREQIAAFIDKYLIVRAADAK